MKVKQIAILLMAVTLQLVSGEFAFASENSAAVQQNRKQVSGVITDANGDPVPGATVMVPNTSLGTISDLDGHYSIEIPAGTSTLEVVCMGYANATINLGSASIYDVTLEEDTLALEEVVVVGYGTQKKVNLTGAVSSVNFEDLAESRPITSVASALAGMSAGLSVRTTSSDPGNESNTVRIRGAGTLNTSSPLYIVDGIEGSLSHVNPHDIATITILKDAASCAIYGNRGANGVVLITTKKGTDGVVNVTYSGSVSFNSPMNKLSFVTDYADYMEIMNEAFVNIGQAPNFDAETTIKAWREAKKNPNAKAESGYPNYVAYPNIDWQDYMYRNVASHDHNISVTGRSEKASYLISANYMDNPGLISNTSAKKYQIRANIEVRPTKWLAVGMQTYGSVMDKASGDFSTAIDGIVMTSPGIYPYYNGYYGYAAAPEESATANNPLYTVEQDDAIRTYSRIKASVYAKIDFLKDFSFKTLVNYGRHWYDFQNKPLVNQPVKMNFATGMQMTLPTSPSELETYFRANGDWDYTIQNTLNWSHSFGKHDLSALLGYEEYYSFEYIHNATKKGLIDPSIWVGDAATEVIQSSGSATDYASRSFFGRLNYVYADKYLFEANLRADGSSRFAKGNRWGFFPSFSAGWRIEQEEWMKNSGFDLLKLRASWGKLGNNSIGNYDYQAIYEAYNYSFNNTLTSGLAASSFANTALCWETTTSTDIGLDIGVLNNRLTAEIDVYNKVTDGILYRPTIYLTAGVAKAPMQNIAEVTNKGIELTLGWRDHYKDFRYSVSGNFAFNHNRVTKYKGALKEYWEESPSGLRTFVSNLGDVSTGSSTRVLEGHTINEYYMLTPYSGDGTYFDEFGVVNINGGPKDGMIRTPMDMAWLKAMIASGYDFRPGKAVAKDKIWYGDYIYADYDCDGIYGNTYDNRFTGKSSTPKYTFGIQASAAWKGIDLQVNFAGAAGFWLYWNETGANNTGTRLGYNLLSYIADDHYFYDPDNPTDPRTNITSKNARLTANEGSNQQGEKSTLHLYRGDYLKMKNLTIGYTLPEHIANKIMMKGLRVYLSGENLFTITSYPGQDPEMGAGLGYVTMRQISLGANLTF